MTNTSSSVIRRRDFLRRGVGLALALPLTGPYVLGAESDKPLRVGCIGVGGMGNKDLQEVAKNPRVNIVALCDVAPAARAEAAKKFPDAKLYDDWRELLDRKDIQAVTVSTPDHTHAPATMTALKSGKHVYCQKPLTQTIHEARQISRVAREVGLVTQMGIQLHSEQGYRDLVDWIRGGVIGKVIEVHAWSDRPGEIWSQGENVRRPEREDPVPDGFDWDLWLSVAPRRAFVTDIYHPGKWRGWLDFGTGAQGDMGCHIIDPVVDALQLGAPTKLVSRGPRPNGHTYPTWSTVEYTFPGTARTAAKNVKMTWYDGGKKPDRALAPLPPQRELPNNGQLFVGELGALLCQHGRKPELLPAEKFKNVRLPGHPARSHWAEWSNACLGAGKASASFDYSGPLTETVLLGNVALHFPGTELLWDSATLQFKNSVGATALVKRPYREGWSIPELG